MKISYISDIHLDFWIKENGNKIDKFKRCLDNFIKKYDFNLYSNILIIAGDLGHHFYQDTRLLLALKEYNDEIVIVSGNHDYYLINNKIRNKHDFSSFKRIEEMKDFCKNNSIHYLDGDIININGVKIGGLGMSWDKSYYEFMEQSEATDSEVYQLYTEVMNDAHLILDNREPGQLFDPFDHFAQEYKKLQKINNVDIMVTHYSPIVPDSLPPQFNNKISTFYYFNGLNDIKRIKPKYWIFGHTHDYYDFNKEGTRFLCNPLGYPMEVLYPSLKVFDFG